MFNAVPRGCFFFFRSPAGLSLPLADGAQKAENTQHNNTCFRRFHVAYSARITLIIRVHLTRVFAVFASLFLFIGAARGVIVHVHERFTAAVRRVETARAFATRETAADSSG